MEIRNKFLIGITGGSGSGKTHISKLIQQELSEHGIESILLTQDNYYKNKDLIPLDENGKHNFDLPESLDLKKYVADIKKLIAGECIEIQEYSYNSLEFEKVLLRLEAKEVIIIEGLFSLFLKEIRDLCDIALFIDTDKEVRLRRRIDRDAELRGYDKDDVIYKFENHLELSYKKYIEPLKKECLVVRNNYSEKESLTALLRPILIELQNKITQK